MKEANIFLEGKEECDLVFALEQVIQKIEAGFTAGMDENDTGSYRFQITDEENL